MSLLNKASLIQIPSGYKDGTLYSAKPTNGDGDFTFSRGSNLAATRVSDGLIEKGRENLLLQSNQFDTTWVTANSSVTSGQSGYGGSNDAWLLDKSGASGRITQTKSVTGIFTFSVYVKKGTTDWILLYKTGTGEGGRFFDLTNGVTGSSISTAPIDSKIESVGNDWYRCSIVGNSATAVVMYVADSDGSVTDTSGNIYIQDSQLESSLIATDYIETGASTAQAGILEDMPRLDYSGGATCGHLLLEPQRSNFVTQSEYLSDLSVPERATITSNADTSPEGVVNASSFVEDSTTGRHRMQTNSISVTSGTTYTFSMFAKIKSGNRLLCVNADYLFNTRVYFDLVNGDVEGVDSGSASIEDYGNGWYRCTATGTATATRSSIVYFGLEDGTSDNGYAGDGISGHYWYGAQIEAGSYPTSYIPTYGASVTRGNDGFALSSLPSFSNNTEFSIYLELTRTAVDTGQIGQHYYFYSVSPTAFNFWLHVDAPTAQIRFRDALSSNATMSTIPFDADETKKIIVKSDGTNFKTFADGTLISTYAMPTAFQVEYFTYVVKTFNLNEFLAFPTALSDDECIQLTTL